MMYGYLTFITRPAVWNDVAFVNHLKRVLISSEAYKAEIQPLIYAGRISIKAEDERRYDRTQVLALLCLKFPCSPLWAPLNHLAHPCRFTYSVLVGSAGLR